MFWPLMLSLALATLALQIVQAKRGRKDFGAAELSVFFGVWLVGAILIGSSWPADSPAATNPAGTDEKSATPMPVEQKFAIVNAHHYVDVDDISVKRARYLLDSLSQATKETKDHIADMAVAASKMEREKFGREIPAIDFLEAANKSQAVMDGTIKLASYFALKVTIDGQ